MDVIQEIIALEWKMFQGTQNKGGRASCQDEYKTFFDMRYGQFSAWTEKVQKSYLEDLQKAEQMGRNLVAEKYLYMMEYTFPEEYEEQKHQLLPLEKEQKRIADEICNILIAQTAQLRQKFPLVGNAGRPLYSYEDGDWTSVETYQRGELYTYSEQTLEELQSLVSDQQKQGISMAEEILKNTVKSYGYTSLERAKAVLKQQNNVVAKGE